MWLFYLEYLPIESPENLLYCNVIVSILIDILKDSNPNGRTAQYFILVNFLERGGGLGREAPCEDPRTTLHVQGWIVKP